MQATVQKWGNSLAARIPAPFAAQLHLHNNSAIDIRLSGESIIITKKKKLPHYTLEELLAGMTDENKPEIVETGPAVGAEFF